MDVKQSTASNLIKALSERGLIAISRDGPDRRAVQLEVLPAGRKVLKQAPGPFAGVLPEALASLDTQTLERLDADLALRLRSPGGHRGASRQLRLPGPHPGGARHLYAR